MNQLNKLFLAMIAYEAGNAGRIQHFTKVHSYAKLIGEQEGLSSNLLYTLETAALVHDIGIKPSLEKYGSSDGKHQEKEGPSKARELLSSLSFDDPVIERVCYLVGHHHTYSNIDGLDYQILVEADFLVNLFEDHLDSAAARTTCDRIFQTKTGIEICQAMFDIM